MSVDDLIREVANGRLAAPAPSAWGDHERTAPPEASTLEVRWILPGPLPNPMLRWFRRFPSFEESREDAYLLIPWSLGLSVKVRGNERLELKRSLGGEGNLDVAGRARGRVGSWRKWAVPLGSGREAVADTEGWRRVRKDRRISRFSASGSSLLPIAAPNDSATCAVELTAIGIRGAAWWTLGFEASGPSGERRDALEAAASVLFDEPLPIGSEFGLDDSTPYSEWLQRPQILSGTEA